VSQAVSRKAHHPYSILVSASASKSTMYGVRKSRILIYRGCDRQFFVAFLRVYRCWNSRKSAVTNVRLNPTQGRCPSFFSSSSVCMTYPFPLGGRVFCSVISTMVAISYMVETVASSMDMLSVWGGRCSWAFRLPFSRQLLCLGNLSRSHLLG
jgi:hypothetical protein